MPATRLQSSPSRRLRLALAAATTLACLALAPSALAASINPVPGSPFPTGGYGPDGVAFSPNGGLLATANKEESGSSDNGWFSDLSVFSVSGVGALTPVTASPFPSSDDPLGGGNRPLAIAFSPNGQLLATANYGDNTVSVYAVGAGGALTPVVGSPFPTGTLSESVAFSPNGGLLAVGGDTGSDVALFTVAADGALTPAPPVNVDEDVSSVAFSPNGQLLAAASQVGVYVFSVASDGALTLISGSPFGIAYNSGASIFAYSVAFSPSGGLLAAATAQGLVTFAVAANGTLTETTGSPYSSLLSGKLAFNPDGGLLAMTTLSANTVSLFSVASTGTLTQLSDSPYTTGNEPDAVAFSPNGGVLAVGNYLDDTVSVFSVGPAPSIGTPTVTGTLGSNGWYTSNVSIAWSISDPLAPLSYTTTGCVNQTITTDETATTYSCSATNAAGTGGPVSVTIQRDATPPTISFTGNSGAYTVNQAITISCNAAALSGIASSTCAANSLTGVPAYTLALGKHTLTASATDNAGLTNTGSTSFTVSVTPSTLCTLTTQFVEGSTSYNKLTAKQQAAVNQLATSACATIGAFTTKLSPPAQATLIAVYKLLISALVPSGWLTPTQATTLAALAGSL